MTLDIHCSSYFKEKTNNTRDTQLVPGGRYVKSSTLNHIPSGRMELKN